MKNKMDPIYTAHFQREAKRKQQSDINADGNEWT